MNNTNNNNKDLARYNDLISATEEPNFFKEFTSQTWIENLEKVGFIYIKVGDEPDNCSSRVYKDKHREFVDLDENNQIVVKGIGTDFDWKLNLLETFDNSNDRVENFHKKLVIFAGPNGSGKSTITSLYQFGIPNVYLNPDEIAKEINPSDPWNARISAGRKALELREQYLSQNISFCMESTVSGKSEISFIEDAISKGFNVTVVYVALDDVKDNIFRVSQRVLKGGHNIPTKDILRRSERSLNNLPTLIDLVPNLLIVDNSKETKAILRKIENKVTFVAQDLPRWFTSLMSKEQMAELE